MSVAFLGPSLLETRHSITSSRRNNEDKSEKRTIDHLGSHGPCLAFGGTDGRKVGRNTPRSTVAATAKLESQGIGFFQDNGCGFRDTSSVVVVWFRYGENVRLDDNPVLSRAVQFVSESSCGAERGKPHERVSVLPLFIFHELDTDGKWMNEREMQFMAEAVMGLRDALRSARSDLVVVRTARNSADQRTRAEMVGDAFRRTLEALDRDSIVGVFYPCGVTAMQRAEEQFVQRAVEDMNDKSLKQTKRERGDLGQKNIVCEGIMDTGNMLYALSRLPFTALEVPDDCDAFGAQLSRLDSPEDPDEALSQIPPLPHVEDTLSCMTDEELEKYVSSHKNPKGPEIRRLAQMEDSEPRGGETYALASLDAYVLERSPLVHRSLNGISTQFSSVLNRAIHAGTLSPRRVWNQVSQRTPQQSLRRHEAWCELVIHDFLRLLTLKRGVHPA